MIFNFKIKNGYIVLTSMLIVGALAAIATVTMIYRGAQFARIATEKNLEYHAEILSRSCSEIGLKEIVDEASDQANYNSNEADFYKLENSELIYLSNGDIDNYDPDAVAYCWVSHDTNGTDNAVYVFGEESGETDQLTFILDKDNNLIYKNFGVAPFVE